MPIKVELIGHTPGQAGLRILGLAQASTTSGGLIRLMRKDEKILGPDGRWLTDDHWLPLPDLTLDGKALVGQADADLVDPLALLSNADIVLATVQLGDLRDEGRLVVKDLRPSGLARSEAPPTEPVRQEPVIEIPPAEPDYTPIQMDPQDMRGGEHQPDDDLPASDGGKKSLLPMILVAALVVLAIAGAVVAYSLGLFGDNNAPPSAATDPAPATQTASTPPATPAPATTPATPAAPAVEAINTREDLAKFIQATPDGAKAYQAATTLATQGKLEFAMLLFQHAARNGSLDGSVAVAKMYDPDSWSKTTSPMPAADAETAAYWYEPAAQGGNTEAQRQLGKILTQLQPSGFQHDKGKDWLQKAADAGDAKAKDLLATVK
ncbi:SEL1-like repeat protein [Insolitispirillum peregrinum]|uniref:Sel1 repeat-containing protein n=1 Tax=Insolitispirillum peregrinum TaxID=80876 RepID=A0A1N7Q1S7_9PROT|nr:sel1 repeat family protein [Insolitispirillum peregrinum]SIT16810.1 hypothetical protein SAMN05421779_10974 [Insolitispirillum peregrinum]